MPALTIADDRRISTYAPNVPNGTGVPGGIPARSDTAKFVYPEDPEFGAVEGNVVDCTAAIQAALLATNGTSVNVVKLGPGDFKVSSVALPKQGSNRNNYTLRGSKDSFGRPTTTLKVTGATGITGGNSVSNWTNIPWDVRSNIVGGTARASEFLEVASGTSFRVGEVVRVQVENQTGLVSPAWHVMGIARVASFQVWCVGKSGNVIQISPGLPFDISALSPVLIQPELTTSNTCPEFVGLEDLIVSGAGTTGIRLDGCRGFWLKNVWVNNYGQRAIHLEDNIQTEIRHSEIRAGETGGSGAAGLLINKGTQLLVEDNIFADVQSLLQVNAGSVGIAFAYNFYHKGFAAVNVTGCHQPFPSRNIWEYEVMPTFMLDNYWGNSWAHILHRTWVTATNDVSAPVASRTFCLSENRGARGGVTYGCVFFAPGYSVDTPYSAAGKPNMQDPHEDGTVTTSTTWHSIDPLTGNPKSWRATVVSSSGASGRIEIHTDDASDYAAHVSKALNAQASGIGDATFTNVTAGGRLWDITCAAGTVPAPGSSVTIVPGPSGFQERDLGVEQTANRKANFDYYENGIPSSQALGVGETLSPGYVRGSKPDWYGDNIWPPLDSASPPNELTSAYLAARLPSAYRFFNDSKNAPGAHDGGGFVEPDPDPEPELTWPTPRAGRSTRYPRSNLIP